MTFASSSSSIAGRPIGKSRAGLLTRHSRGIRRHGRLDRRVLVTQSRLRSARLRHAPFDPQRPARAAAPVNVGGLGSTVTSTAQHVVATTKHLVATAGNEVSSVGNAVAGPPGQDDQVADRHRDQGGVRYSPSSGLAAPSSCAASNPALRRSAEALPAGQAGCTARSPRACSPSRSGLTPGAVGERACGILESIGAWRSLVARTVRVGEVPGSNPGAPDSSLQRGWFVRPGWGSDRAQIGHKATGPAAERHPIRWVCRHFRGDRTKPRGVVPGSDKVALRSPVWRVIPPSRWTRRPLWPGTPSCGATGGVCRELGAFSL